MMRDSIKKRLFRSFFPAVLVLFIVLLSADSHAIRPPAHYHRMARNSMIKALATVKEVKVVSETERFTTKMVRFDLEQALDNSQPGQEFSGTCASVDHSWQEPGAGGTLYYYPAEGARVLVTVSHDGGPITHYQTLTSELEEDIREHGLRNIFRLAYSEEEQSDSRQESWFIFYQDNEFTGHLHRERQANPAQAGTVLFSDKLIVLDKKSGSRTRYTLETRARLDEILTPERLTIMVSSSSSDFQEPVSQKKFTFRQAAQEKIPDGILVRGDRGAAEIGIPPLTTTDLLLFSVIEKLPFRADRPVHLNILETLEMHLKKGVEIRYTGRDEQKDNLHRFDETGPVQATYWLNDEHELQQVRWDSDKLFKKSSGAKILQISAQQVQKDLRMEEN